MKRSHRLYDAVKRPLDAAVAAFLLVLLAPVLIGVAVAVRLTMGSPVLFRQQRPGLGGRLFTIYKFRTMRRATEQADATIAVASDADRLTRLGSFLRSTSMDELPELWNVVVGDMGLIGPRPLLPEYLPRYNSEQARRHDVRPGITGWAQVNGRNATTWEERFEMDVYYVDNRSFALDARVLWRSIATVLGRKGVSAPGSATMPPFDPAGEPEREVRR